MTFKEAQGQNLKYLPYSFTENGVAMLSSVLKSETTIEVYKRTYVLFPNIKANESSKAIETHKNNPIYNKLQAYSQPFGRHSISYDSINRPTYQSENNTSYNYYNPHILM